MNLRRLVWLTPFLIGSLSHFSAKAASPEYSIQAIRYASAEDDVAGLVMGAPKGEKIKIAMAIWLIRGGNRNILFDSGYYCDTFVKRFPSTEYIRPDEAVKLAGLQPEQITDIVVSHAHSDHMGGIDLFPKATIWIQKEEYRYYAMEAWQPGGNHGGIDPADVQQLVKLNTDGRIHLVDGDNVEIFPGIRAYTGARHTYASEYLRIDGNPAIRAGLRQRLSLSESCGAQSQRHVHGHRSCRERCRAVQDDRAGRFGQPHRSRARRAAVSEVPHHRLHRQNQIVGVTQWETCLAPASPSCNEQCIV